MIRIVMALFLTLSIVAPCPADELTDAIVGADPRKRLQSGRGVALDHVYGPEEEDSQAQALEAPLEETAPSPYGSYLGGLRSPLMESGASTSPSTLDEEEEEEDANGLPLPRLSAPKDDLSFGLPN